MASHIHHFGRQNARGAVQGRERLIQLGHAPADGGFPLDQMDRIACVGDIERSLNAGDAGPNDQHRTDLTFAIPRDLHRPTAP